MSGFPDPAVLRWVQWYERVIGENMPDGRVDIDNRPNKDMLTQSNLNSGDAFPGFIVRWWFTGVEPIGVVTANQGHFTADDSKGYIFHKYLLQNDSTNWIKVGPDWYGNGSPEGVQYGYVGQTYEQRDASEAALDHPKWVKVGVSQETANWSPLYGLRGSGSGSLRVGPLANAVGDNSAVIGSSVVGNSHDDVVLGHNSTIPAVSSGGYGTATAFALGYLLENTSYGSVAIGTNTIANDALAIAIGWNALANGTCAVAIGGINAACHTHHTVSIGSEAHTWQEECLAIGHFAESGFLGGDDSVDSGCSIALGGSATALGFGSIAIGFTATCDATPLSGAYSIAIGAFSHSFDQYAVAIGYNSQTSKANQLMIGGDAGFISEVRFNNAVTYEPNPNIIISNFANTTTATDGFLYLSSCAGAPTGIPSIYSAGSSIPITIDTVNNKLYAYIAGTWKSVLLS